MATGNHFLDTLSGADFELLSGRLALVDLRLDQVLIDQDGPAKVVHFPVSAQLANVTLVENGGSVETTVIGQEGLSGLAPAMADANSPWQVLVRAPGSAWSIRATDLRQAFETSPALRRRLLNLTHFYQAQAVQAATCNALHRVGPRVARWLLTAADLTPGATLHFTQEELARLLGAQRTSIVGAFVDLKEANIIRHSRGTIDIRDRRALISRACSCYGVLRRQAEDLGVLPVLESDPPSYDALAT